MIDLLEYLFRRLRGLQPDPTAVGLAAGIALAAFLWKKGRRMLFALLTAGLLLRWMGLGIQISLRREDHV